MQALQDYYQKDADSFSMSIEDSRRDDGSGIIKLKREAEMSYTEIEKANRRELAKDFHQHRDSKIADLLNTSVDSIQQIRANRSKGFNDKRDRDFIDKMGWRSREKLDEYRTMKQELFSEAIQNRPTRGPIKNMSKRSKKNIMDQMQTLDYQFLTESGYKRAKFLTLTYPRQYPDEKPSKVHLFSFLKRIRRKFPKACAVWKMELQKRGAPHFHIIFFQLPKITKEKISDMWAQVIGDTYHDYSQGFQRNPMTRIETIRNIRGIIWYTAKYISKREGENRDDTTLSEVGCTGGFNSAPKLTAKGFKANYQLIETIVNRAQSCGEEFVNDRSLSRDKQQAFFLSFVDRCIRKHAYPSEKEILSPSCGRVWGKHNAKELQKIPAVKSFLRMDYEILTKLKKYAKTTRGDLRINDDCKGFTFYVNDDSEREWLMRLLNSLLEDIPLNEAAPF